MKNLIIVLTLLLFQSYLPAQQLRVLNFQGDNGYQHDSKDEAKAMIELLGAKNGWEVVHVDNANREDFKDLSSFDVSKALLKPS